MRRAKKEEAQMKRLDRRTFLKVATGSAAVASVGGPLGFSTARAQAPLKLKFANSVPATHSVNVRLREAFDAIRAETGGRVEITLFPNNQLGSDTEIVSQLRSGALELAT